MLLHAFAALTLLSAAPHARSTTFDCDSVSMQCPPPAECVPHGTQNVPRDICQAMNKHGLINPSTTTSFGGVPVGGDNTYKQHAEAAECARWTFCGQQQEQQGRGGA